MDIFIFGGDMHVWKHTCDNGKIVRILFRNKNRIRLQFFSLEDTGPVR